jgi:hypothetical protein
VSIEISTTGAPRKTGAFERSRAHDNDAIASTTPIERQIGTESRSASPVARDTAVV